MGLRLIATCLVVSNDEVNLLLTQKILFHR